ncbi:hypothetical protein N7537_005551 [Penicillium hordei]|uniref:Uncharacterized protein n=1 Tax=Penicillium hordei TaxID=40994 RepID=A0AAD6E5V2_9EURO|nr:uncharacterized protein N7537_005551 [Penicillium hordei]KAJ5602595.1 hypothetical protein N7537_005551 [Penicillium hordei]
MELSYAINELCKAQGKCSFRQYYQLMREYDGDEEVPSIRLSSLNSFEVEHVLSLSPAKNDQGLNSFPIVPVPDILVKSLAMTDGALRNETSVEANMRWRMNYFILLAFNIAVESRSEDGRLLEITHEPRWSFGPVKYKGEAVKLSGYPSYALWYGDEDEAASNVIVAQNQRFRASEKGIPEVLGYLGFIYHHRKNANKENCPLYGVATDSRVFHFVRLDDDSSFVTSTLDSQADLEKAFSLLVYVLKEAMIVPSTQPQEPSTQSDRAQQSAESLIPAGSSLRRKLDRRIHYQRLKEAANDSDEPLEFDSIDDEYIWQDFSGGESSSDEYFDGE